MNYPICTKIRMSDVPACRYCVYFMPGEEPYLHMAFVLYSDFDYPRVYDKNGIPINGLEKVIGPHKIQKECRKIFIEAMQRYVEITACAMRGVAALKAIEALK